jgi:NDP-sugar pyrophosphorylase family protein
MDVRAIIVIGAPWDATAGSASSTQFDNHPYALVDVLGKPLVFRIVERLKQYDITKISVVTDAATDIWPTGTAVNGTWVSASHEQLWNAIEKTFTDDVEDGAEHIVFIRLGAYTEIDYRDLLEFHVERHAPITCAVGTDSLDLDTYVITAAQSGNWISILQELRQRQPGFALYPVVGYVNRLSSPNHLRQLAIEGLMQRIQLAPEGHQIKPGVWLGRGAQVHKRARILSPAFIGAGTRVRAAAVVTRCTALEHHTVVDCGTVVENVTTLPYTYLGAGLDVTHSVVGHSKLFNLKRGVKVEFSDPRLIGEASSRAPLRAIGSLLSLASFFPAQLLRGLFAPSHRECPASLPEAIAVPSAALERPAPIKAKPAPAVDAGEFPSQLAVARRYGNE